MIEITLRDVGGGQYVMEARWPDLSKMAYIKFKGDPKRVTLEELFRIAADARDDAQSSETGDPRP